VISFAISPIIQAGQARAKKNKNLVHPPAGVFQAEDFV